MAQHLGMMTVAVEAGRTAAEKLFLGQQLLMDFNAAHES
jgi:hypothetical protein